MSRHDSALTDAQWAHIAPLWPEPQPSPQGAPNRCPSAPVSKASCGWCAPGHDGRTYPGSSRHPVPAGAACVTGKSQTSGSKSCGLFSPNSRSKANSMGPKPSPTAALPRSKNGALCRQNDTGQRDDVDGGRRRPRSSAGKPLGLGVPGRSDPPGADHQDDCGPPQRPGATTPESRACHL